MLSTSIGCQETWVYKIKILKYNILTTYELGTTSSRDADLPDMNNDQPHHNATRT